MHFVFILYWALQTKNNKTSEVMDILYINKLLIYIFFRRLDDLVGRVCKVGGSNSRSGQVKD